MVKGEQYSAATSGIFMKESSLPSFEQPIFMEELHNQYSPVLYRYAMNLVKDHFQAEDLMQDTYLRAWKHQSQFEALNGYQKKAWLYQVLKNLFLDELRKQERENHYLEELEGKPSPLNFNPCRLALMNGWS